MVGSNTVVGHGPTVGQPKFPEATGHRAGIPRRAPYVSRALEYLHAGRADRSAKARSASRPAQAWKGRTYLRPPRGRAINGRPRRTQLNYLRRADKRLAGASVEMVGHSAGDLVGHTKGAMVGQVCGIKLGHTVAGIVIPPGTSRRQARRRWWCLGTEPCASPNGQSRVGRGQNAGTSVGQLNRVGQASIKLGHCTGHGRQRSVT